MLSANTVWLEPNDSVAPMSNVNFRKAMAYALNPAAIAQTVYGGIAAPASPTGLLPGLSSFVNQGVVSADAPRYNTAKAKQYLAASGYHGQAITLQVPEGWSDWMDATTVIKDELQAVGINISVIYPQANTRTANVDNGNYDLQLDNNAGADSTPWSYYQRVYALPIAKTQDLPAQLGADRLAGRLVAGTAGGHHSADRHRQAGLDLHPAADRLLRPAAGDPALVQRRLVPGEHLGLVGLPGQHRFRPEHAGHVGRLPRRDDHGLRAGRSAADAGGRELTLAARHPISH